MGQHTPVLCIEVVGALARPEGIFIDATVGSGGHAAALLEASGPKSRLLGIDLDPSALRDAAERLRPFGDRVTLVHGTFAQLQSLAEARGFSPNSGILFDLGLRSDQLAQGRGFSFRESAPLDMRFDPTQSARLPEPAHPALRRLARRQPAYTASEVLAQLSSDELAAIFREYADERFADRIADAVVSSRKKHPLRTTDELSTLVVRALPPAARHGRLHAATRVFQALRIAVNRERESLEAGIQDALALLASGGPARSASHSDAGGRLAVLSYHSGEDRLVKQSFRGATRNEQYRIFTKKPITPSAADEEHNPRSRSAKLRILTHTTHP